MFLLHDFKSTNRVLVTQFHVEIVLLISIFCQNRVLETRFQAGILKKNSTQQPRTLKSWVQDTISILKSCFQNTFLKRGYFTKLFQNNNNLIN